MRCIKGEVVEEEECRLFNLLADTDGNSIAQIDMQALPKGGKAVAGIDIATPLGTLLTAQLIVKIDAGKAKWEQSKVHSVLDKGGQLRPVPREMIVQGTSGLYAEAAKRPPLAEPAQVAKFSRPMPPTVPLKIDFRIKVAAKSASSENSGTDGISAEENAIYD